MKKIVLFGAFDRYNYGDNLMPILFQIFMEKYASHLLLEFEFEFLAISDSNLEQYGCKTTKKIDSFANELPDGSFVVVVGGEVLCAKSQSLFLHMQGNQIHHFLLKAINRLFPHFFSKYAKQRYSTTWEFPFIPAGEFFPNDVKVIFNTVGGDFYNLNPDELDDVSKRLDAASYVSVRDNRTYSNFASIDKQAMLAPDSAVIMSDLISMEELRSRADLDFPAKLPGEYLVFQAAPNKLGCSLSECCSNLLKIANETGNRILLLPIGYASGHDDYYLLKKVHKALPNNTVLLNELTIWQIMYVIARSNGYIGTSLHGAITAMSYNLPHFCINKKIAKLHEFVKDWSVPPYNQCYAIEDISKAIRLSTEQSIAELTQKTISNIEKVKINYQSIVTVLKAN